MLVPSFKRSALIYSFPLLLCCVHLLSFWKPPESKECARHRVRSPTPWRVSFSCIVLELVPLHPCDDDPNNDPCQKWPLHRPPFSSPWNPGHLFKNGFVGNVTSPQILSLLNLVFYFCSSLSLLVLQAAHCAQSACLSVEELHVHNDQCTTREFQLCTPHLHRPLPSCLGFALTVGNSGWYFIPTKRLLYVFYSMLASYFLNFSSNLYTFLLLGLF